MATTIVWDDPKRERNLKERKLDFADLTEEFFMAATTYPAREGRLMAIGEFRSLLHVVIFKPLGTEAVSVISMPREQKGKETLWASLIAECHL